MVRPLLILISVCLPGAAIAAQTVDPGQQLFSSNCAACHGLDGRGGEHAPNIATDPNVQRMTDREITGIVRYGIKGAGMPAFQTSMQREQITAVVKYLRSMGGGAASTTLPGDALNGRALYFGEARCGECHSVDGKGGYLGADLSGYGGGHSAAAIREAILDPNKNPDLRHGTVTAVTRDGKTYTGMTRNEDNFSLQMQTPDGAFLSFNKSELARVQHEPKALMPDDYGQRLNSAQIDDLVKFLSQAPGPKAKAEEDDQ